MARSRAQPVAAQFQPHTVSSMTPFDPSMFSQVVNDFSGAEHEKFHALLPAREHIAELRRKGASYATIAELLSAHSLPTCRSAIARFCHQELGEKPRTRRRALARRTSQHGSSVDAGSLKAPAPVQSHPAQGTQPKISELLAASGSPATSSSKSRGPRIAHIPLVDPTDS